MDIANIALSGFVGAVVGGALTAWLTYKLQSRREERLERERRLLLLHQARFYLIQQHDHMFNERRRLEPFRKDPDGWRTMNPPLGGPEARLVTDQIGFILRSKDPDLLSNLFLADLEYYTFRQVLEKQGELRRELAARISTIIRTGHAKEIKSAGQEEAEAETMIGLDVIEPLKGLTDQIFIVADRALAKNISTQERLSIFINSEFHSDHETAARAEV